MCEGKSEELASIAGLIGSTFSCCCDNGTSVASPSWRQTAIEVITLASHVASVLYSAVPEAPRPNGTHPQAASRCTACGVAPAKAGTAGWLLAFARRGGGRVAGGKSNCVSEYEGAGEYSKLELYILPHPGDKIIHTSGITNKQTKH